MKIAFLFCLLALACSNSQPSDKIADSSPLSPSTDTQTISTTEPLPGAPAEVAEMPPPPAVNTATPAPVPNPAVKTGAKAVSPSPAASSTPMPNRPEAQPAPKPAATPSEVVAPGAAGPAPKPPLRATDPLDEPERPSHDAWNALLTKHVSASGKVNYQGFRADRAALDAYLQTLAASTPQPVWSRNEKMAYWINAYNAFTVDLIVDNMPVASITKLDNGKPWDVQRITLGGKKYSLNEIENEILRPQFKDARIHFALNCAAKSCPPLYSRAFTSQNLERLLEQRTKEFINNAAFTKLSPEKAEVSKIFDWYAADFGNIPKFLNRYAQNKINENAAIGFKEYDWDLND